MNAKHPPAAATTMLITLGGFRAGLHTVVLIAAGVLLVSLFGELSRRLHPSQRAATRARPEHGPAAARAIDG